MPLRGAPIALGRFGWIHAPLAACLAFAVTFASWAPAEAQPIGRRATTVAALLNYPLFFHGHTVRVRGTLISIGADSWLETNDARVLLAGTVSRTVVRDEELAEMRGTFWDVGRLRPDDIRIATLGLEAMVRRHLDREWPGVGEFLVLAVEHLDRADPFPAIGIAALALEPERYAGERVTITGRFSGRNLYGELPQAPALSRSDFVLQSADAAVWVTGLEPRGRGFNLDVGARVDTGRSLEVSGIVRYGRGLVWLEGEGIALAEAAEEVQAPVAQAAPQPGPQPEVLFSAPTQDEINVSPNTTVVRIQFSSDMNPASFAGRVQVRYLDAASLQGGGALVSEIAFQTSYDGGNRVLHVRLDEPLQRFSIVEIELLEGIEAVDGALLPPWTLTFSVGG